jgi:ankyrin repeat protein
MTAFSDTRKPFLKRRSYSVTGAISCGLGAVALLVALAIGLDKDARGLWALAVFVLSAGLISSFGITGIIVGFLGLARRGTQRRLPATGILLGLLALLVLGLELWWPSVSGLVTAAHSGDLKSVQRAVRWGVDVNKPAPVVGEHPEIRTPLSAAADGGQFTISKLLLDHGAQVDQVDGQEQTALFVAADTGRLKIVELLLEKGASPGFRYQGQSPLHVASAKGYRDIAAVLVKRGANVNLGPTTPLHLAAAGGHYATMKLLLDHGANVNAIDARQRTPLHEAAAQGYELGVKLLLEQKADANAQDVEGLTPLDLALRFDRARVVQRLLGSGGRSDVFVAIGLRDLPRLEQLLQEKPQSAKETRQGRTPLHDAANLGLDGAVKLLIARGADVDALDDQQRTPLLLAVKQGHAAVVDLLLEAGADASIRYNDGELTAPVLYFAIAGGHAPIVSRLLQHGVDVNAQCDQGQLHGSVLYFAVKLKQPVIVELLLGARAQPNAQHSPGAPTPLYEAIRQEDLASVQLLLKHQADPNQPVAGQTPIALAESRRIRNPNVYGKIADALVEAGAHR